MIKDGRKNEIGDKRRRSVGKTYKIQPEHKTGKK